MPGAQLAVKPAYLHVPDYVATAGPQVCELARDVAGYAPDLEQAQFIDVVFAVDREGLPAAFETGLLACRQNLKTGAFKIAVLGWLFLLDVQLVVWTSHEMDLVEEAHRDLETLIKGSDWLRRRVRSISHGSGDLAIELRSGARCIFKTRTPGAGVGLSGDKIILDEAWKLKNTHMGGLVPTLSTRPAAQLVYGSSAAHADSEILHPLMKRGRAAASDPAEAAAEFALAYIEYSAPPPAELCMRGAKCDHGLTTPGCGCDDPVNWRFGNTTLGKRISESYIRKERRALPPGEFGRERMGWPDAPEDDVEVISAAAWALLADDLSEPGNLVSFAVVFAADRRHAAIGLAGWRPDGNWHVEVAEYREGTSWCAGWIKARCVDEDAAEYMGDRVAAVVVDDHSHEAVIIAELEDAGIRVFSPSHIEVTMAYGMFYDAVTDTRSLRHRGQEDLDVALAGATTREVGDAGRAWGRRKSGVDIAPLVAVTSAMYGHSVKAPMAESEPGAWVI